MNPTNPVPQPQPVPAPVASQPQFVPQPPVVQYATPASSVPFGLIGAIVSVVGLVLLPILQANMGGSYLLLIITILVGLTGAGLSFLALKQSDKLNTVALAGLVIGVVVASLSFVQTVQYGIAYSKVSAATQKALDTYNSRYSN
jgi:hypothetical protein